MNTLERNVIDYQRGNERAFNYIHGDLKGLAYTYAKRGRGYASCEDLAQEAFIGLLVAARTWDPTRGVAFYTYARLHMRWAVSRAFAQDVRRDEHEVLGLEVLGGTTTGDISAGVNRVLDSLDDARDIGILEGVMNGDTLEAIGVSLGLTKQAVSLRCNTIKRRVGQ